MPTVGLLTDCTIQTSFRGNSGVSVNVDMFSTVDRGETETFTTTFSAALSFQSTPTNRRLSRLELRADRPTSSNDIRLGLPLLAIYTGVFCTLASIVLLVQFVLSQLVKGGAA